MSTSTESDARPPEQAATTATATLPRVGWIREGVIVLGFYYVYQAVRSVADHGGVSNRAHRNARYITDLEKAIGLFHEQAIQQLFIGARWFIRLMNIYYGTLHFLITAGLLVWLYMRRQQVYRRMRNLLGATTALALVGYWAFPLAPPRLDTCNNDVPVLGPSGSALGKCFIDTLDTIGGLWSYHSPVAKAVTNPYAAMPSLHFGWALWCGLVLWTYLGGRRGQVLGVLYPLLTLFAVVVTANHYFLDAVGGAIILLAAHRLLAVRQRRRSATKTEAVAPTQ